ASLLSSHAARREAWRWAMQVALLAFAYWLFGHAAPAVPQPGTTATLLWPPAGIALAALLRWGLNVWPGIAIGAWLVTPSAGLLAGPGDAPHSLAPLLAAGCTLGPVLAAMALRREGLHLELDRRRDLWLYGAIGVFAAPAISALNGSFWLTTTGAIGWAEWPTTWVHWWVGDAMGAIVVGIPLLTCSRNAIARAYGQWRWIPSGLLTLGTLAAAALAFVLADQALATRWPLAFVPHLLLCWLAARSGLFAASAAALLLTLLAWLATAVDIGPFIAAPSDQGVELLAAYVCSLLVIPLLTTALTGELAANERRWHVALDSSEIGVGEWDLASGRVELSARWLAMLGHDDQQALGRTPEAFWALLHLEDVPGVQHAFAPLRESRTAGDTATCRAECRMRRHDGSWRWFELHAIVSERDANGEPLRIVSTARDIADLQAARERQQVAESLFEHLHEGLLITDAQNRVIEANPAFTQITGYGRHEVLGIVPDLWRTAEPGSNQAAQRSAMQASLDATDTWRGELIEQRRDGGTCVLQLTVSRVRNPNGSVRNHVIGMTDITHAREQLEQLQRQAHFDELTRLPNRARLAQMMTDAIQTSRREGSLLTVCYLDLDHFKPVNDRFGHDAGDRLLVELANRMRRSLRSWAGGDDVVARIGGDEFVLLLRTATLDESRYAVERVLHQICQPYALGPGIGPTLVTASIGATVFPLDGADAETLLRHADHAMYGAKQAGRNGYLFFDAEHDRRAEARFVALGRVQEALDRDEFRLFFQPKVDMRSTKVLGVEALLRWRHPEQGVISPAQFLPLIENTGLSVSVGNWVLQHGIDQLAQWLHQGLDMTLSINVSARHLQEPLFAQHLAGLLSRHRAPVAQHLILEVLETAALADVDYTIELMEQCRELGVRFALDDFGTGYSTFTYLKRLPLDMLKIDRSFVINMLSDRQDLAIVEGVIGLSQTFGCSVVAEGVETPEQARRLIEIGCEVGQGNGIAPAMPADHVLDWVRDYRGIEVPRPTPPAFPAPITSAGVVTP
ncbi:MAG TPA: EAL domain-containing protein, partial [Burkholderiaceae bacterium]